jgi:hypothetical protein
MTLPSTILRTSERVGVKYASNKRAYSNGGCRKITGMLRGLQEGGAARAALSESKARTGTCMGSLPKEPGNNSPWWEEEGYKGLLIEYEALKNASSRIALSYDFPSLAQEWLRPSYTSTNSTLRVSSFSRALKRRAGSF